MERFRRPPERRTRLGILMAAVWMLSAKDVRAEELRVAHAAFASSGLACDSRSRRCANCRSLRTRSVADQANKLGRFDAVIQALAQPHWPFLCGVGFGTSGLASDYGRLHRRLTISRFNTQLTCWALAFSALAGMLLMLSVRGHV